MDICSNIDTRVSEDVTTFDESSLNDLTNDISESLNIQGEPKLVSTSIDPSEASGLKKEEQDPCEEPCQSKMTVLTPEKIFSKSSTFPSSSNIAISDREIEEKEAVDGVVDINPKSVTQPCQRSISLPMPSKLRSALKGSREKHGTQPTNNLTVKWAPDVYDPTPTAVSHVVTTNKNQPRNSKKNGKNKKRGTRGKDKKQQQTRKYGGSTSNNKKSLKSLDDDDDMAVECARGLQTDLGDFNVGGPDPHCGSSFLKKSVTLMHFSLAEAT